MMTTDEAIRRLNLMIEKGQEKNNEAIKVAVAILMDKRRSEEWKYSKK